LWFRILYRFAKTCRISRKLHKLWFIFLKLFHNLNHNDVKIFLVCTRFHNEKSLPVRQITWIMLTKTEIMRTISHFFGQNYFHNHDQNFKLCTRYENNFDQNFFAFSKLFIEPNFWTNFRFRLIWDSVHLSLFGRPRFGLIWNSVRLSLFSRPRFGLIGNSVQLSPLVFLGCCNVAFFIMEASTDQKNFHDIMRIMAVNIGPNYFHNEYFRFAQIHIMKIILTDIHGIFPHNVTHQADIQNHQDAWSKSRNAPDHAWVMWYESSTRGKISKKPKSKQRVFRSLVSLMNYIT